MSDGEWVLMIAYCWVMSDGEWVLMIAYCWVMRETNDGYKLFIMGNDANQMQQFINIHHSTPITQRPPNSTNL